MIRQFYVSLTASVKLKILLSAISKVITFQILNTKRFHELELERIS